jgi:hypothetical protein
MEEIDDTPSVENKSETASQDASGLDKDVQDDKLTAPQTNEDQPKVPNSQSCEVDSKGEIAKPQSDDEDTQLRAAIALSMTTRDHGKDSQQGATALPTTDKPQCKKELVNQIKGVLYGNCIGDAIGLLTEFMTKTEAKKVCCFYFSASLIPQ